MTAPRKVNGVSVALIEQIEANLAAGRVRSCEAKNRYTDEFVARAVGTQQMAYFNNTKLYVYKCRHCNGWHLTRQEQPAYFAADYLEKEGYK